METKSLIEKILESKGITAKELSAAVGISESSINGVLKGRGIISKYGVEKLNKYCLDNGIKAE